MRATQKETRPVEVHLTYCPNCPSHHGPSDPEADDIRQGVRAGLINPHDAVFPCAWRPKKLCRGVCDEIWASLPNGELPPQKSAR
jgi:hypothetical protein